MTTRFTPGELYGTQCGAQRFPLVIVIASTQTCVFARSEQSAQTVLGLLTTGREDRWELVR